MRGGGGPQPIGEVLERFLRERGVREQVSRFEALERWDEAVGEKIAEVAKAVRVDGGVLFVEVRSSAWMMELEMMKGEVLERLNEGRNQGRIEKIRFRLAPDDGEGLRRG